MTRVRVHSFTISLDGYGAGPRQTRQQPLGVGGEELHEACAHGGSSACRPVQETHG